MALGSGTAWHGFRVDPTGGLLFSQWVYTWFGNSNTAEASFTYQCCGPKFPNIANVFDTSNILQNDISNHFGL